MLRYDKYIGDLDALHKKYTIPRGWDVVGAIIDGTPGNVFPLNYVEPNTNFSYAANYWNWIKNYRQPVEEFAQDADLLPFFQLLRSMPVNIRKRDYTFEIDVTWRAAYPEAAELIIILSDGK